jgi:hypothetical protein
VQCTSTRTHCFSEAIMLYFMNTKQCFLEILQLTEASFELKCRFYGLEMIYSGSFLPSNSVHIRHDHSMPDPDHLKLGIARRLQIRMGYNCCINDAAASQFFFIE